MNETTDVAISLTFLIAAFVHLHPTKQQHSKPSTVVLLDIKIVMMNNTAEQHLHGSYDTPKPCVVS